MILQMPQQTIEINWIEVFKMALVQDYLKDYIDNIQQHCIGELGELQQDAYKKGLPIIPNDVVRLMAFLLEMHKPKEILEIGMAVGFSASFMCGYLPNDGHITTIDRYPMMIDAARENFKKLGVEDKITIMVGDALDILPTLENKYDFIFMDAAKGQYIQFLPYALKLLKKGGIMVADDVLQEGRVAQDYNEIPRRQRTIHKRMNEFLSEISNNPKLTSSILTIGDGVALIRKVED